MMISEPPPAYVAAAPDAAGDEAKGIASLKLPPLGESCKQSGDEIVVCGRRDDNRYRHGPPMADAPTLPDEWDRALQTRIGPVQIQRGPVHSLVSSGTGVSFKIEF